MATRIKPHAVPLNDCDCHDHRTKLGERLIAASRAGYRKSNKGFFHCAIAPSVNVSGPTVGAAPAAESEPPYTLRRRERVCRDTQTQLAYKRGVEYQGADNPAPVGSVGCRVFRSRSTGVAVDVT